MRRVTAWFVLLAVIPVRVAGRNPECQRLTLPPWSEDLGYRPDELFPLRRGHLGMPFVEVLIGNTAHELLFDTGNMVGLTLATPVLDRLDLPEVGRWNRLDSDGRIIGTFRRARAPSVRAFGRTHTGEIIYEFADSVLGGLVGPDLLPGTRFTIDYASGIIAVTQRGLDRAPDGFIELPLAHSVRFPRLILAPGRVNGHPVLIEFDTGASRTNIDPALVQKLNLPRSGNGVAVDSLTIGSLSFSVPSARINPKADIDPSLTPPIQLAVGSDIISQLIFTVDYSRGRLLIARRAPRK